MKKLNQIQPPYEPIYQDIIDSKTTEIKNTLNRIIVNVNDRLNEYQIHFNNNTLERIQNSPFYGTEKKYLQHCYDSRTKSLDKLKTDIKINQDDVYQCFCPYCGIGISNSFDHYMPKEQFSEFSILPINLIPCCSTCNGHKGVRWHDDTNRLFINFYLDDFFEEKYLYAKIEREYNKIFTAKFELIQTNNITDKEFSIINSHFDKLHLENRYKDFSSSFIYEQILSLENYSNTNKWKDEMDLKCFLLKQSNTFTQLYGINNIKTALMYGMQNSIDFIDYIIN